MANQDGAVRAVERALQIFDCFATGKSEYTLMELSREIGLAPSTTLRLLGTLEKNHYLHRNENMRYGLDYKLVRISHRALSALDLPTVAQPFIEALVAEYDESAGLYAPQNDRRVCVARLEGTKALRQVIRIGDEQPLTRGAAGRVLLAYLPEPSVERLIQEDPYTNREQLARVRARGFAISYGERDEGIVSVAAPVFGADGEIAAALFISSPKARADESLVARQQVSVTQMAREISLRLGHMGA